MDPNQFFNLSWWVSAVELPVLGGLFWLIWRTRRETEVAIDAARRAGDTGDARLRDQLADFKLEVAKGYASIASLDAVERRLVAHLERIEQKLDHHLNKPGAGAQP